MTTDIYTISGRSKVAGRGLARKAIGIGKLLLSGSQKLSSVVRGVGAAASWKGVMDRIAFAAILLLALGLWIHPYVTGTGDPTAHPAASGKSIDIRPSELRQSPPKLVAPTTAPAPLAVLAPAVDFSALKIIRGKSDFWRLGQTKSGVWWFVSPADKPEFLNTVQTVQPYQLSRDKLGIHYVSRDWDETAGSDGKPTNLDQWAQKTATRIMGMGFKGIGAWSNPIFHKYNVPITRDLNLWTWVPPSARRMYYPEWSSSAEYAIQTQVVPLKDNHNLVGYFIDNELDWGDQGSGPSHYFDGLASDDPNRIEVVKVIQSIWPRLEDFNRDWHAELKDWHDLHSWQTLPHEHSQAYSRLFSAWLSHLADDYFRISCGYIRKYDPNHLVLGVRFRGYAPREVVRASRGYTDAQSINYYVSDARLDLDMFRMMNEESGQPVMISEYSFHSMDGRSGNRNTVGFAAQVLDQQARADAYHLFTLRAARVPYLIGVDWFQWSDEPPGGRAGDGEDVNFGIVDVDDDPYQLLVDAVQKTSPMLNPAHAASVADAQADVWRESFANRPIMHVPYLGKSIEVNGELSDWPQQARVPGIRHSQTVGLDRSKLPLPNVYLGWTDEGLFMGLEVFDNDIYGAPANGWWWTRDYAEFWLSTRSPAPDQNNYDVNSHQFFFVPNSWPGEDGLLGTVGQWHRPGDALQDNLIPHPQIRDAVRVLPDRYVVEMFIPGKALHGWDPRHEPVMAFNMHVRNFQQATDYFWSAPKEIMTQLRPNTWGLLYLDPPNGANLAQARAQARSAPVAAPTNVR